MTRGVPASGVRRAPRAPTPEDRRIADYVAYDPETGAFTWKISRGSKVAAGSPAGSAWRRKGDARWVIRFEDRGYQANRVAWLIVTGDWPVRPVDHRDGDGLNNRWLNLRLATGPQNAANARKRKDNTSGHKGVTRRTNTGQFEARIQHEHRRISLGRFATAEEARCAYERAAMELHGEFARVQ